MKFNKIITRTVWLVSLVSLFTDVASEMLYPVMPVYLRSIGFTFVLIGVLEGLAEAVAGLSKGYFGNLSDKQQSRVPFVRFGYSLSAVSKPMLALFTIPLWIFFARTLDRLGKGVRTGARDAMLSAETTPEHKGKVFGFHRSMDTLGAAIGPFAALVFLYFYPENYKLLFIIAFVPGLLAIALTFLLKDKAPENQTTKQKPSFFEYLKYWKTASIDYKKLVIGLLAFTVFNSSDAFLLLVLKNQGVSDTGMIGFYIFYNLVYAAFSYPMGYVADKIGLKRVMIFGLMLFVVVYTSISFTTNYVFFGILFFVYGIYASATEGISKALITNWCKKSETATAIGFYTSMGSICALIASSLGGFLWTWQSPQFMFVFSGIGVALVVIYLVMVFRTQKN